MSTLVMTKHFHASKVVAVPATFVIASTTSDAVEAAATLGAREFERTR